MATSENPPATELERPEVRISLRALTWRGSERANPILASLKPALDAFRAADYQRADAEFSAIDKAHPGLIEVALYQGIARLFLGDIAGASTSLQRAERIHDPAFANDVLCALEDQATLRVVAMPSRYSICAARRRSPEEVESPTRSAR